jgi:HEAT repeat protein
MSPDVEAKVKANLQSEDKMLSTVSHWALALTHPDDKKLRATATEQLVEGLKDKDAFVRVAAARGLASLPPDPQITLPIVEKALKGADETTIQHALDALAHMGAPAVPRLIEALKHEKLRPLVAEVLGKMGPIAAPATGALAALINDADEHTARSAIVALAGIGPGAKQAVPALTKALGQKDRPDTFAIIYALGRIGPAAAPAKPALTAIVADPKNEMSVVAAWALVKIDPKGAATTKAVPALTTGLNSPLAVIRRGAAEALGEMGRAAKGAEQALARAAQDEDASVRDAAAKSLAAIRR